MDKDFRDILLVGIPAVSVFIFIYYSKKELATMQAASTPVTTTQSSGTGLPPLTLGSGSAGYGGQGGNIINISEGATTVGGTNINIQGSGNDLFPLLGFGVTPSDQATALSISQETLSETTGYLNSQNAYNQAYNQQLFAQGSSQLQTVTNSAK